MGFCVFNLKSQASNMEMQIAEASPAVRFSLCLLLFSRQFCCCLGGKSLICKPGCSKFEHVEKRHAKLQRLKRKMCGFILNCVSGKGGLLSWLLVLGTEYLESLYSQLP